MYLCVIYSPPEGRTRSWLQRGCMRNELSGRERSEDEDVRLRIGWFIEKLWLSYRWDHENCMKYQSEGKPALHQARMRHMILGMRGPPHLCLGLYTSGVWIWWLGVRGLGYECICIVATGRYTRRCMLGDLTVIPGVWIKTSQYIHTYKYIFASLNLFSNFQTQGKINSCN